MIFTQMGDVFTRVNFYSIFHKSILSQIQNDYLTMKLMCNQETQKQ